MAELKERMTFLEAVQYLNLCEAYVSYLIQNGELSYKRDERDARYFRGEDLVAYQELCRTQVAAFSAPVEAVASTATVDTREAPVNEQLGLYDTPAPKRDVLAEVRASRGRAPRRTDIPEAI
jgi:hypothetical protein